MYRLMLAAFAAAIAFTALPTASQATFIKKDRAWTWEKRDWSWKKDWNAMWAGKRSCLFGWMDRRAAK